MPFRSSICNQMLLGLGFTLATALTAHASVGQSVHVVSPYPSRVALTANPQTAAPGAVVVFAATFTKTSNPSAAEPTGEVTFTLTPASGGSAITATVPVESATATWSGVPPIGTDTVVATYPGDGNYAPITAQTTITALSSASPDFDFTLPSVTIHAGQSFNGSIQVKPLNGFNGKVSFTVGQLPQKVTFSIPSPSVELVSHDDSSQADGYAVSFAVGTQATIVASASGLLLLGFFEIRRRPRQRKLTPSSTARRRVASAAA